MIAISRELPFALRRLRRDWIPSLCAMFALAIGIAVSGTMFAVIDNVVRPPAPFPRAADVFVVGFTDRSGQGLVLPARLLHQVVGSAPSVGRVATEIWAQPRVLETAAEQRPIALARVDTGYFALFGVRPVRGRLLSRAPVSRDADAVVIGEGLWRSACAVTDTTDTCTLRINQTMHPVIGVVSQAFAGAVHAEAWMLESGRIERDSIESVRTYARLRSGATPRRLLAELATTAVGLRGVAGLEESVGDLPRPIVLPIAGAGGGTTSAEGLLSLAAGLVLLLVAANLSSLALGRAVRRYAELALRAALGANKSQLAATLAADWVVIVAAGAALGWVVTLWTLGVIDTRIPPALQIIFHWPQWNMNVLIFELAMAASAAVVIGLTPVLVGSRVDVRVPLAGLSAAAIGGRSRGYLLFVGLELALTIAVVAVAGAILSSVTSVSRSARSPLVGALYSTNLNLKGDARRPPLGRPAATLGQRDTAWQAALRAANDDERMLSAVAAMPGASAAALHLTAAVPHKVLSVGDRRFIQSDFDLVSIGFPQAIGAHLIAGRSFTADDPLTGRVALVDEGLADRLASDQSVIGTTMYLGAVRASDAPITIVGVIAVPDLSLDVPFKRREGALFVLSSDAASPGTQLIARFDNPAPNQAAEIAATLQRTSPASEFSPVLRSSDVLATLKARQALLGFVVSVCGVLGLLLAAIGVYGVVSAAFVDRARELALRSALGANAGAIVREVLRDATVIIAVGSVAGAALAEAFAGLAGANVYGFGGTIVLPLVVSELVVCGIVTTSCLAPARRGLRIDPAAILRA